MSASGLNQTASAALALCQPGAKMPDTPTRFFRRHDGRLHPAGWLLLAMGAVLFIGMALFAVSPVAPAGP